MRFSLRQILCFVVLAAIVCGLVWVIRSDIERRNIAQSDDNLKAIGVAILQYDMHFRRYPSPYVADAQGRPLCSWRVSILPFVTSELYPMPAPDKPWNNPRNARMAQMEPNLYHSPADPQPLNMTSYLAVVGPNTIWSARSPAGDDDPAQLARMILAVEVPNSGINWTEPRDLTDDELRDMIDRTGKPTKYSLGRRGIAVVFADGHVERFVSDADFKRLAKILDGAADEQSQ